MKYAITVVLVACMSIAGYGSTQKSYPIIVRTFPHDPAAFTQGLLFYQGMLYESTGLVGYSSLRCVDPADGRVVRSVSKAGIFLEGLARMGNTLVQLSWTEKTALIYSLPDLRETGAFRYGGEGWGLTSDSSTFIMSNGSDTLFVRSKTFAILKKIPVTLDGKPVKNLNELEYVNGVVYANIWYNNNIVAIALKTGKVGCIIDCSELVMRARVQGQGDVLNGIAYNPQTQTFYLTGKNWATMFEVKW